MNIFVSSGRSHETNSQSGMTNRVCTLVYPLNTCSLLVFSVLSHAFQTRKILQLSVTF